jgi:hypothetical protein
MDDRTTRNEWHERNGTPVPLAFGNGEDFTREPHTDIDGEHPGTIMNSVGARGCVGDCAEPRESDFS